MSTGAVVSDEFEANRKKVVVVGLGMVGLAFAVSKAHSIARNGSSQRGFRGVRLLPDQI